MLKKILPVLLSAFFVLTGCFSTVAIDVKANEKSVWTMDSGVKIITATDLHFISPRIMDKGASIMKVTEKGDGKITHYTPEITDAFFDEVIEQKPDFLVLTGDLTYNGELASHEDLSSKLKKVEESGIKVSVIPGNHDIRIPFAYSFEGDKAYYTDSVTDEEFKELYKDFGYGESEMKDPGSFSYVTKLNDSLWLIMIDVNTAESPDTMSASTTEWLNEVIDAAAEKGIKLISSTHQNLLTHNNRIVDGYKVNNSEEVLSILQRGKTFINLSGHIHVQDVSDNETGMIEIDTGSMAVADNSYAVIQINKDDDFKYYTKMIDVAGYAKKLGSQDPNLLDFTNYSRQFFLKTSVNRTIRQLISQDIDIPDEELDKMTEIAARLNLTYFQGRGDTVSKDIKNEEGYKLWEEYGQGLRTLEYMNDIINGRVKNENIFEVNFKSIYK